MGPRLRPHSGIVLCLKVRSIGEGAELKVKEEESRIRFTRYDDPWSRLGWPASCPGSGAGALKTIGGCKTATPDAWRARSSPGYMETAMDDALNGRRILAKRGPSADFKNEFEGLARWPMPPPAYRGSLPGTEACTGSAKACSFQ